MFLMRLTNPNPTHFELSPIGSVLCELIGKVPERFIKLIDVRPNGCWMWLGSKRSKKYKHTRYYYGTYCLKYAHRIAYQAVNGPIPTHLELDHLCHNKLCVNPAHLEAVTHQQNCARRKKSGPYRTPGSVRDRRARQLFVPKGGADDTATLL